MASLSTLKRLFFGKPIATKHAHHERLPKRTALAVFASDALSSTAYATEEMMLQLLTFKVAGIAVGVGLFSLTFNLSFFISLLIFIVCVSYYQTIHAYPKGGGSYVVVKSSMGTGPSLVVGAALMIDYVLTVAVSISAGVLALVSLQPVLKPYMVPIGVVFIAIIALANLRGAKESGLLFSVPTYTFVGMLIIVILWGIFFRAPAPLSSEIIAAKAHIQAQGDLMSIAYIGLLLKAFSSGCTALTGIEAISDSTQAFKEPTARNASATLLTMAVLLSILFMGSSYLAEKFHLMPLSSTDPEFKTVMAQLCVQVFGEGLYFQIFQVATVAILILAANTAFADFPRLTSFIAKDSYLPRQLGNVGDRLVFQNGVILLAAAAVVLVIAYKGDTHSLIPLYAVGVFISFTLSQFGMMLYSKKHKRGIPSIVVSAFGGVVTAVVMVIIFVTKFSTGAWLVPLAMGAVLATFVGIRRHYAYLAEELSVTPEDKLEKMNTTVLLLVPRIHRGILHAIAYARSMSQDCRAIHVTLDSKSTGVIKEEWNRFGADIPLVILDSQYRSLVDPVIEYIDQTLAEDPDCMITVIVPQAVPKRWYHALLHNNVAIPLKLALSSRENVVITNVRYFLK